jgi:hypothetical protein
MTERRLKPAWWPENPYPADVFPLTAEQPHLTEAEKVR